MASHVEDRPETSGQTRLSSSRKKVAAEPPPTIRGRDEQPGDDAEAVRRPACRFACQGHHHLGTGPLKRDVSDDVSIQLGHPRTDGTAGCNKLTEIIGKTWRVSVDGVNDAGQALA